MNKKGVSEVVTTVIFVSLALVAVGIVWAVVSNIIGGASSEATLNADCLGITFTVDSATCGAVNAATGLRTCTVSYTRQAGGGDIAGVKTIIKSATNSISKDTAGTVAALEKRTVSVDISDSVGTNTGDLDTIAVDLTGNPTDANVVAYLNVDGEARVCKNIATATIATA